MVKVLVVLGILSALLGMWLYARAVAEELKSTGRDDLGMFDE